MVELISLNKYLQAQADTIWNKINTQYQDTYDLLTARVPEGHLYFPSSILKHNLNHETFKINIIKINIKLI